MMDQLTELSDEQVAELQSAILSEFEAVENETPTPQTVDAMTSLADMLDGVRNETKRREAAVEELTKRASEAASRVHGQDGDSENMDMPVDAEEAPAAPEEAPAEEIKPADAMAEAAPVVKEEEVPAPTEEAPAIPVTEETPADEAKETPVEEEEEDKKEKSMTEASTEADKNTEFSTPDAPAVTEETAAVAEEAAVVDEAPAAEVEAEAPAAEDAAADEATSDAAADVADGAEAAIIETPTTESTEPTMVQEIMEAPVTAAADNADNTSNIEVPADRRPVRTSAAAVAITAGADIPGYTAGSPMNNMNDIAVAMEKRLHGLRRVNGGDGEQHIVASITTSFPEERTLSQDAESNWAKVQAVTGPEALVASGGHSTPFEVKYDIFGLGTTARPVRDALPRFQADRGGIRFVTPPVLSSYANAVGTWTNVNDITPGTDVKTSLTVTAASENTVATDAVTLQMQFGNLMTRAYPELIARHNELGLVQHAREAEQYLLSKIGAASTAVTTTSLIGFGRDFLVQLGRASAAYRSRHRLEADAPLRVIIPAWVKDAMAADLTLSMPGDSTLNAYAEIEGYVAARNVNLSVSLDQNVFSAQSSGALNEFADSFDWYIFAEGSFLFLDGGTLDLGIIRDSTLVGTNDYKMFVETFEGIAFVGVEALKVTSTISINGVAAALRDTTGGATAAAIEY
jgi:hypothetical protein